MARSYSASFRTKMVQRLVGPRAVPAYQLAQEVGVHTSTLSRWLRDAQASAMSTPNGTKKDSPPTVAAKDTPGRKNSGEDKVRLVFAAEALAAEERGALLCVFRRHPGTRSNLTRAAVPTAPGQPFQ
jgi:transposase-like protein